MPEEATQRACEVAVMLLDTRVNGKYLPREAFKKAPVPITLTARRIAARLTEAVSQTITGEEIISAHSVLKSQMPTYEIRERAQA